MAIGFQIALLAAPTSFFFLHIRCFDAMDSSDQRHLLINAVSRHQDYSEKKLLLLHGVKSADSYNKDVFTILGRLPEFKTRYLKRGN
ncbi:hypothetical protein EDB84DRAFT_226642 [Lactarius hengduanensis]|nr:hypothetical protein EDB84DRAFT_226642 [Lactarius hengduanensis]